MARSLMRHTDRTWLGGSKFGSGPGTFLIGPKPPQGNPGYTFPMANQKIEVNSTAVTANDSSTENVLADVTIPALSMSNEGAVRLLAQGTITNTTDTGGTVTFKVKLDTTTVMQTSGIACSTSASPRNWVMEVVTLGNASNVQTTWGTLGVSAASTQLMADTEYMGAGVSNSTLSELAAIDATITAQMSAGSTGFSVVQNSAILESII